MKYGFFDLFEGSDIDKKVINRLGLIFFGLFAIVILILIIVETKAGACDQSKQAFYQFEYSGKIIKTYKSRNHGHWMTVFEDGTEKEFLFDFAVWERLKPGDMLIKHKKELNFIIISGKDTTFYKENIPDCEQFME